MISFIKSVVRDQAGATAIEYGLIAALVAIAAMGGMSLLGTSLNSIFTNVGSTLQNPTGS
jgi:pilus assembly protein Flp/PilA